MLESTDKTTLLVSEAESRRVRTGCAGLDAVLRGGLRSGTITEVYGESGSGKTQLCLQTALSCQKGAVYVSTEGFPTRRLRQMLEQAARTSGTSCDTLADNIFIRQLTEECELQQCLRVEVPALLSHRPAGLLIVDSVAAIFRVAYDNYSTRARHMRELAMRLLRLARDYDLAVLCVNQVTSTFTDAESEPIPALGLSWSNMVSTRLRIAKTDTLIEEPNEDLRRYEKIRDRTSNDGNNCLSCNKSCDCNKSGDSKTAQDIINTEHLQCKDIRKVCNTNHDYCKKSVAESNKSERDYNKSEIDYNKSERGCNKSEMDCKKSELDCNKSKNKTCIVRSLKVVFAPDLPNTEVHFVVTMSGIKCVTLG